MSATRTPEELHEKFLAEVEAQKGDLLSSIDDVLPRAKNDVRKVRSGQRLAYYYAALFRVAEKCAEEYGNVGAFHVVSSVLAANACADSDKLEKFGDVVDAVQATVLNVITEPEQFEADLNAN